MEKGLGRTYVRTYVGYDRKRVLRTGTGYRICPDTNPVLLTGTGICFLLFRFRSIRNRIFKSLFRLLLNRIRKLDFIGFLARIYWSLFHYIHLRFRNLTKVHTSYPGLGTPKSNSGSVSGFWLDTPVLVVPYAQHSDQHLPLTCS